VTEKMKSDITNLVMLDTKSEMRELEWDIHTPLCTYVDEIVLTND
jgi:hypothetical protein